MKYENHNQNRRIFSYDRYKQRINNQDELVKPANNFRNVNNYEDYRNYNNYLDDENNSGIRKINDNKIRFHYNPQKFQNDYNHNNNDQYYYNLEKHNILRKNEEEFNNKIPKENKINAGYLYNTRILSEDKSKKNNENNFNDGNKIDQQDYKIRREKPQHQNHNNQELKGKDYRINNRPQSVNNYYNHNINEEHNYDDKGKKRDENFKGYKFIDAKDIIKIKNSQNTNSINNINNGAKMDNKNYMNNNYNNNNQNKYN